MRILFFVEPFPVRGRPLDYQWVLDKWLLLRDQLVERGNEVAFAVSNAIAAANATLAPSIYSPKDFGIDEPCEPGAFDREWVGLMTTCDHPVWAPFARGLLERTEPDVVVSWTVNKPLQKGCRERSIPILHVEVGPVRTPEGFLYYGDPIGVNGDSAVSLVWPRIRDQPLTAGEELRLDRFVGEFLRHEEFEATRDEFRVRCGLDHRRKVVGIFQQVSRDSNVLAWANVRGNDGLIAAVAERFPSDRYQLLVKTHPNEPIPASLDGVRFRLAPDCVAQQVIDVSDAVCLINSSVGVEVLAAEKPLYVFGRAPYSMFECTRDGVAFSGGEVPPFAADERTYSRRLLHFLFTRYLIGERELSDPDAFLARLERLRDWHRRSGTLEEWFVPEVDAARLRDMRARYEAVQLQRQIARDGEELAHLRAQCAELRSWAAAMTERLHAAQNRLEIVEPANAAAVDEVMRLTDEVSRLRRDISDMAAREYSALAAAESLRRELNTLRASLAQRIVRRLARIPGVSRAAQLLQHAKAHGRAGRSGHMGPDR